MCDCESPSSGCVRYEDRRRPSPVRQVRRWGYQNVFNGHKKGKCAQRRNCSLVSQVLCLYLLVAVANHFQALQLNA